MFAQRVAVHYADGTETEVVLTQWSMGQFAQYAQSKGWKLDPTSPGLLGITMLRYQAYCELHRDPTAARPQYDRWDFTVQEVEPLAEAEPAIPTNPVPSDD